MTSPDSSRYAAFPARRPEVEWVELDGEALLYDPTTQVLHRLNRGAAAVWAACGHQPVSGPGSFAIG
jgi:hypothetical protein